MTIKTNISNVDGTQDAAAVAAGCTGAGCVEGEDTLALEVKITIRVT